MMWWLAVATIGFYAAFIKLWLLPYSRKEHAKATRAYEIKNVRENFFLYALVGVVVALVAGILVSILWPFGLLIGTLGVIGYTGYRVLAKMFNEKVVGE